MPLRLVAPRKGKSQNWTIRGTYLGIRINRSTGATRKAVALDVLRKLERHIELGEFSQARAKVNRPTFLTAALAYMRAGRSRRYVARLIEYFGDAQLPIEQADVDTAAAALYPAATPATRNRTVYVPVSAIQRHVGLDARLRRPKGAKGRTVTDYLTPRDATAIIAAAEPIDAELALLLRLLLYTGVRLGTALQLRWEAIQFEDALARVGMTKNGDPILFRLRPDLLSELAAQRPAGGHGRVFRFHQGGHLKHLLLRAKLGALGLSCPSRRPKGYRPPPYRFTWVNYHTFRHTWATWMRLYGGLDLIGLVATGNWRDPRSAARYAHAVPRAEWAKVDDLPSVGAKKTA